MRWLHVLSGIMWIGLLYYFNFVQVPAFAAFGDEARARNIAIDKVARKALWWFRWAAISTFVTGIFITIITKDYYSSVFVDENGAEVSWGKISGNIAISTGMVLAALLFMKEIADMTRVADISENRRLVTEPVPPGWCVLKISGPLFFAAADRIFSQIAGAQSAS